MDIHLGRKGRIPMSSNNATSFSVSKEPRNDAKASLNHKSLGLSRFTSGRPNQASRKEVLGESSKLRECPSSSRLVSKKSAFSVPKVTSPSSKPSTSDNHSKYIGQIRQTNATVGKHGHKNQNNHSREELSKISRSKERACQVELNEGATTSRGGNLSQSYANTKGKERVLSRKITTGQERWDPLDLINADNDKSDLFFDQQKYIWTEEDEGENVNIESNVSLRSLAMADSGSSSADDGKDNELASDGLFTTAISASEIYFDTDVPTSSNSPLPPKRFHRGQVQGRSPRIVLDRAESSFTRQDDRSNMSRHATKQKGSPVRRITHGLRCSAPAFMSSGPILNDPDHTQSPSVDVKHTRNSFMSNLPSHTGSSSQERAIQKSGHRRTVQSKITTDTRVSTRSRHLTKLASRTDSNASSSRGSHKNIAEMGPCVNISKTNVTSRMSRTVRDIQTSRWCSREVPGEDVVVGSRRTRESSSRNVEQTGLNNNRREAVPVAFLRGRSHLGSYRSDGGSSSSGERLTSSFSESLRRGPSSSSISVRMHRSTRNSTTLNNNSHDIFSEDGIVSKSGDRSTRMSSREPSLSSALNLNEPHVGSSSAVSPVLSVIPSANSPSLSSSENSSLYSFFNDINHVQSRETREDVLGLPMLLHSEGSRHRVRALSALSIDGDSQTQYTIEDLAELLFALERIEQDEELTYEQVLMLEANLLSDGINFHDQHSGMRLDIDNMSYEELLALEERIGNVSTGLTDDAISKCMSKFCYVCPFLNISGSQESEVKCCICQEEYLENEELGRLTCEHSYHIECIRQWLLQKNQCPICKAAAA
eukprot:TRINITY_DN3601_c0_g2_i1.p1 TRINITY_DN3601_c0_g2~~TRINITY_DN3601_c0_g2_i1.p1  ORF type:complete len:822 (-),score=126.29 TRINITY_DN3601_c0_g2_i1:78-2543(-)